MTDSWKLLSDREAEELIATLPPEWSTDSDDESIDLIASRLESSRDVDEKVLETLAYSPYWKIRRAVALSPSCSDPFIQRLKLKKLKDHWGVNPDEVILQALRDRALPPEWRIEDTDVLIEKLRAESAPNSVLEQLVLHDYPSVVEAVVRAPNVSKEILAQIHQRCIDAKPAYRFADVLAALGEVSEIATGESQSSAPPPEVIFSEKLIGSLESDYLELLFGALAIAGVEDVVNRDQSEVWTLLGESEPDNYDYGADSHTEVMEKATATLADNLGEAYQLSHEAFDSMIQENKGYYRFWQKFSEEDLDGDIDSFSDLLDRILEDIS